MKAERADDTGRWSSEELLLRAAWYYYQDELTQDEIGRRLSMSRASVGRLLDRARRVGLVSINLNTEYLDAFELSRELRQTFGLAEALVVPDEEKEPFDHHGLNARVGLGGAQFMSTHLRPGASLGVGLPIHDRRIGIELADLRRIPKVVGVAGGEHKAEGAVVAVNQLAEQDAGETLRQISEAGGDGFGVIADMRDPEQVTAMVQTAAERGGRLDYVVSNAAINPFMAWDETTVEDFNNLFETNVRGTWMVCTEGAKQMIREGHGGAICCVSSISAHVGAPGQTAYCGTKGAISMLAKALACDLGAHGIRMNAVEPGWVMTITGGIEIVIMVG